MNLLLKLLFTSSILFCCLVNVGCKMTAPMHTWKAAKVDHAPAVRIAVGPIGVASRATNTQVSAVPELQAAAASLQEAMQSTAPSTNPNLLAIHPPDLERWSAIQLVSFDQQPNDSAMLGAARNSQAQFILQGNVVNAYLDPPDPRERPTIRSMIFGKKKPPQFITTHWTIIDVSTGQRIAEETLTMDIVRAEKHFKQNGFQGGKGDGSLMAAAAKDAWGIVASTTQKSQVQLDLPWFWAGSASVRKGNGFARQGRWDLAEREWQDAAENHPWNKAAWKNLSISAVAKEDFELARSRLKHADTFWPGDSTFKTQLWLEQQQRHYHKVMGTPPPQDGWTFPDATIAVLESNQK
jgi:hypothetical protein